MLVDTDPLADAILALRAKGHRVEPSDEDPTLWRITDEDQDLSVEQLIALALRLGLAEGPGRVQ